LGQKTHPYGIRLGIIKSWRSKWFASNNYAELLQEDLIIRRYTNRRLEHAGIAEVEILRAPKKVTIDILTARPGIVIGRKGAEVDKLKEELQLLTGKEILLNIIEIKKPEISATLVAQSIAKQLEGRVNYRRAMKKALAAGMKSGAEGMKIVCSGRLAGAEIARTEKYHDGRVPLHGAVAYAAGGYRLRHRHRSYDLRDNRREGVDMQGRDYRPTRRDFGSGGTILSGY
jgi:small subunit ribosomal protein S3